MTKFVNPYNFIPFENEKTSEKTRELQYRSEQKLISGWMDVALYTKTPLIIPDGAYPTYIDTNTQCVVSNPSEDQKRMLHKKYAFLKYGDSYVIPGSELRGMTRSMYEAVTNSCVHAIKNDKPISQRVPTDSAINRRGLLTLENDCWVLYDTQKILVKKFSPKNKDEARRMKEEIKNWPKNPGAELENETYLQYNVPVALNPPSERNPKGQPYSIYRLFKQGVVKTWEPGDDTPYKELKSALKRDGVTGNQANANARCMKALCDVLEEAKDGKGRMVPVYFFKVERKVGDTQEELVYLSGSSIGRIGHHRKWEDVLEGYTPCTGPNFCPACLLFGSIRTNGLKGRVRFTDAYIDSKDLKGDYRTLGILGEPRSSAFEFYYRRPSNKAKFWNQDFESYKNQEGTVSFEDLKKATPRGRKMYWHSQPVAEAEISRLNSTMEAINTVDPIKFRVFFDGITQEQLQDLEWVITLGENNAEGHRQHKLGHAKPLGYGSVKLVIEKLNVRKIVGEAETISYTVESSNIPENVVAGSINQESISVKSVLRMVDVETTKNKFVAYPHSVDKNGEATIFGWFAGNRKNLTKASVLPEPTSKNIELEGSWPEINQSMRNNTQLRSEAENQLEGKIKFFNQEKGFGVIVGENGKEYFCHRSNINGDVLLLKPRVKVRFTEKMGKKGPEAREVSIF